MSRIALALILAVGAACSDATGSGTAFGWEYNPAARGLAGRASFYVTKNLIIASSDAGSAVAILNPATGREQYRLTSLAGASPYRAGSLLVGVQWSDPFTGTYRVYDGNTGALIYFERDRKGPYEFLGSVGGVLIAKVADSALVGIDRQSLREVWRKPLPSIACDNPLTCGVWFRGSEVADELLLWRISNVAGALLRVSASGTLTMLTPPRTALEGTSAPLFAVRASPLDPIVMATSRYLTTIDATSGAALRQTKYASMAPTGFFTDGNNPRLTADGKWLTVRMVDSTRTATEPLREMVLRTADGTRVRERTFTASDPGSAFLAGPCGTAGDTRIRADGRVEYTDVATGQTTTAQSSATLSRSFVNNGSSGLERILLTGDHFVFVDVQTNTLVGVACKP